jgi:hypothetical protein
VGPVRRAACVLLATGVLTSGVGAALAGPASAHPVKAKRKAAAAVVAKRKPPQRKCAAPPCKPIKAVRA